MAQNCTLHQAHASIACETPEGYGDNIKWRVSVAKQLSSQPKTASVAPAASHFVVGETRPVLIPQTTSCLPEDAHWNDTVVDPLVLCEPFTGPFPQGSLPIKACGPTRDECPVAFVPMTSVQPVDLSPAGGELLIFRGSNLGVLEQNCLVPPITCSDPWGATGLAVYYGPPSNTKQ